MASEIIKFTYQTQMFYAINQYINNYLSLKYRQSQSISIICREEVNSVSERNWCTISSQWIVTAVVGFKMLGEMIRAREALVTDAAGVRSDAGVWTPVTRQFVGTRERPRASGPRAGERLFTRVTSHVRLQVRTLAVGLAAPGEPAHVDPITDAAASFPRQVPPVRRCRRRWRW